MLSFSLTFAQKVEVNSDASTIKWHGKKIGGEHYGNIKLKSGTFEVKDNQIKSGTFTIDMTSITCTDLTDPGYNGKLVGHLKSDDFFGVDKFPTANFVVTESTKFNNDKASVTGEITIKGKKETITFDVMKSDNAYSAKLEIDRSKFDVRYGSNSFFDNLGDKAIDDIFTLDIKLVVK
jgi:polyisoprenoid-binding protein YceI